LNVNDANKEEVTGDKLEVIFKRQRELMEKYEPIEHMNGLLLTADVPVNLNDPKGQARLKDFAWRVTEELGEAMNCLKNKPWKQTHMETDEMHYKEEIADAFHFFVELCILSGFTADSLADLYLRKSQVNQFRQRSGY
jgi:hypothetical protein